MQPRSSSMGAATVEALLPLYDTGWWSLYDLYHLEATGPRNPCTAHYHDIHVKQLTVMHAITGRAAFRAFAGRWAAYQEGHGGASSRLRRQGGIHRATKAGLTVGTLSSHRLPPAARAEVPLAKSIWGPSRSSAACGGCAPAAFTQDRQTIGRELPSLRARMYRLFQHHHVFRCIITRRRQETEERLIQSKKQEQDHADWQWVVVGASDTLLKSLKQRESF